MASSATDPAQIDREEGRPLPTKRFATNHPLVGFLYFTTVIVLGMLTMNPVSTALSFLCSGLVLLFFTSFRQLRRQLRNCLFLMAVIALVNPLLNHRGITVLFYLFKNPVTLESTIFGISSAVMLASVLLWIGSYSSVIDNERFLFLFARRLPGVALMLSMMQKLLPVTRQKAETITAASQGVHTTLGAEPSRRGIKQLLIESSALLEWSMEDSIETADSMKARGYGVSRRSSYSVFRFRLRDGLILAAMLFFGLSYLILGNIFDFDFYPSINWSGALSPIRLVAYGFYIALMLLPILQEFLWQLLRKTLPRGRANMVTLGPNATQKGGDKL